VSKLLYANNLSYLTPMHTPSILYVVLTFTQDELKFIWLRPVKSWWVSECFFKKKFVLNVEWRTFIAIYDIKCNLMNEKLLNSHFVLHYFGIRRSKRKLLVRRFLVCLQSWYIIVDLRNPSTLIYFWTLRLEYAILEGYIFFVL